VAISDNDEQLARQLIRALHDHEAGWVAAEVEEARELRTDYEEDVRMLLIAISQTLGLVPSLLLDASRALSELPERTIGIALDDTEVAFDYETIAQLTELKDAAAMLSGPVAGLLSRPEETE
jgi:hypothetical protein